MERHDWFSPDLLKRPVPKLCHDSESVTEWIEALEHLAETKNMSDEKRARLKDIIETMKVENERFKAKEEDFKAKTGKRSQMPFTYGSCITRSARIAFRKVQAMAKKRKRNGGVSKA